mmetsp:Transcript_16765/g.54824  ORF Transcript_16765/g.54824 Transcript_16765/m.54824 type:complete len:769 (+) Transcript_16765:27-2333(+)
MDAELAELFAQLEHAQAQKSAIRLSERNVVELVSKLQELGLFDGAQGLLHTSSGREYLTHAHLREEVKRAVVTSGGRLPVLDLPALLDVDLSHCERHAAALSREEADAFTLVEGELITPLYFDGVAAEVEEELQLAGFVSVAELVQRFALSSEMLTSALGVRIGSKIEAHMEAGLVYTPEYVERIRAQLRGALRGSLLPSSVSQLVQESIDVEGGAAAGVAARLVEELLAEKQALGSLRGGGASWTPAAYGRMQRESVNAFFSQNGYIEYETARRIGLQNPKTWLQKELSGGIALQTAYAGPGVMHALDASIEAALMTAGWCDAAVFVPVVFSTEDVAALLSKCQVVSSRLKANSIILINDTLLLTDELLKVCKGHCESAAATLGATDAATARSKSAGPSETETASSGRGGGKTKGKAGRRQKGDDSDDDDPPQKIGKASKGKKTKGSGGKQAGSKSASSAGENSEDTVVSAGISVEVLANVLREKQPDLDETEGFVEAIAIQCRRAAQAAYDGSMQAALSTGMEARRKHRDEALKLLQETAHKFSLLAKGVEVFDAEKDASTHVHRHLLRTVGAQALDILLSSQSEFETPLSAQHRESAVQALPADAIKACRAAQETLKGSDAHEFLEALENASEECGARLRRLDKRGERSLVHAHRKALESQLALETDPAQGIALAVPLAIAQTLGRAVSMPGRALGPAVAILEESMPPDIHAILTAFHSDVVRSFAASSSEDSSTIPPSAEELAARLEEVKTALAGKGAPTPDEP